MKTVLARFGQLGLRLRLVALGLMAASPALVVMVLSGIGMRDTGIRDGKEQALGIARMLAENQEERIEEAQRLLLALASVPVIREARTGPCSTLLAHLLHGYAGYTTVGVAAVDGQVVCSAPPAPAGVNLTDRPVFRQVLATQRPAVGVYTVGRVSGKPSIGVAHPIVDQRDALTGVLYTALDLRTLSRALASTQLPPGTTVTFLDRRNVVFARYPDAERWIGRDVASWRVGQAALRLDNDALEGSDLGGREMVYGFARLGRERQDGTVIVGLDKQSIVRDANGILMGTLLSLLLVIVVSVAIASVAAVLFVVRPVHSLLRATHRLEAGDLAATASVEGTRELRELAQSFNSMAESLRRRTMQVEQAEQRYRGLFERNLAGIFRISRSGRIVECNATCAGILGYPSTDAVKAVSAWQFYAGASQRARVLADLRSGKALTNRELRLRRLDGSEVWVSVHVAEVVDNDRPYFEGMMIDISDRMRAENAEREAEELAAMVRERQRIAEDLHDGIIQSIYATGLGIEEGLRLLGDDRKDDARARLQDAVAQLDVVIRDVRNCVAGLHPEGLQEEGLARALANIARDLELNALASVVVDAAPGVEEALTAQMTRELFHVGREALANVVKHTRGAHAVISLSHAGGAVRLRIEDDGRGFQAVGALPGQGLRNIAERVRRLGGEVTVDSAAGHGTRITVKVPLAEHP